MTTTGSVLGTKFVKLLQENPALQLQDVLLGDQQLLPHTPAACVVVGPTATDLVGAARRVEDQFQLWVILYHCKITDNQEVELECNERAEAVADYLNTFDNGKLDDLVLHGYVVGIEPGYARRDTAGRPNWYKSSRITWQGMNRRNLSYTP